MCVKLQKLVRQMKTKLTGTQKAIFAYLAQIADEKYYKCFPSLSTIARQTCFERKNVFIALKFLIAEGWISKGESHTRANQYIINMAKLLVDNHVQEKRDGVAPTQVDGVAPTPMMVSQRHPIDHVIDHSLKDHHDYDHKNCGELEYLKGELHGIGWHPTKSKRFIRKYGVHTILKTLSELRIQEREGTLKIKNMGGYLTTTLEKLDIPSQGKQN